MSSVSVIIPTWNRAVTLERAVKSVLCQTYPVIEILVCDDGSTDNSKEIISRFNNGNVKWIEGPRAGMPSVPRNRGIAQSKGEWLAFLDSDDEWLPEKIEKQIQLAGKLQTKAVCSNAFHITANGKSAKLYTDYSSDIITYDGLVKSNYVICSTSMVHRSLTPIVKGFPETKELKALEDYALWLRVATQTNFAFVTEPLAKYYDNASESIRADDNDTWGQRMRIFSDLKNWLKSTPGVEKYYSTAEFEYKRALQNSGKSVFLYSLKQLFS
jgi:teichuronic acid biosynthesis glycosyltransferase TuaG